MIWRSPHAISASCINQEWNHDSWKAQSRASRLFLFPFHLSPPRGFRSRILPNLLNMVREIIGVCIEVECSLWGRNWSLIYYIIDESYSCLCHGSSGQSAKTQQLWTLRCSMIVFLRVHRFSFDCNTPPILHTDVDFTIRRTSDRYLGISKEKGRLSNIGEHWTDIFFYSYNCFFKWLNWVRTSHRDCKFLQNVKGVSF